MVASFRRQSEPLQVTLLQVIGRVRPPRSGAISPFIRVATHAPRRPCCYQSPLCSRAQETTHLPSPRGQREKSRAHGGASHTPLSLHTSRVLFFSRHRCRGRKDNRPRQCHKPRVTDAHTHTHQHDVVEHNRCGRMPRRGGAAVYGGGGKRAIGKTKGAICKQYAEGRK